MGDLKVTDFTGFGGPIKKLIAVLNNQFGRLTEAYLIRTRAAADAEKIKVITAAVADANRQSGLPVVYKDERLEVTSKEVSVPPLPLITIEERSVARIEHQQVRQQGNIECVTAAAAEELSRNPGETVSPEYPSDDWTRRFFDYAQDISDEMVRRVWGRVLAGEIKQPGAFSIRTLDALRNFTKDDAVLFERMVRAAIFSTIFDGRDYLVPTINRQRLADVFGILRSEHIHLSEIGMMYPSELSFTPLNDDEITLRYIFMGDHGIRIDRANAGMKHAMNVWKFSKAGSELATLIDVSTDLETLRSVGRHFVNAGANATIFRLKEPSQLDLRDPSIDIATEHIEDIARNA
jgi:hypothetical protein